MRKTKTGRLWVIVAAFVSSGLLPGFLSAGATVATQGANVPPGSQYVAMGSSYAAGFFIQPQEPGAGACGRSLLDYPHLVAAKLRLSLNDVSCGGAVTANALDTPQGSAPPQIDAVTPNTRLVTMTIGGSVPAFHIPSRVDRMRVRNVRSPPPPCRKSSSGSGSSTAS